MRALPRPEVNRAALARCAAIGVAACTLLVACAPAASPASSSSGSVPVDTSVSGSAIRSTSSVPNGTVTTSSATSQGDPGTLALAATTGIPIPATLFGMHPSLGVPTVPVGAARLWDTGTRWSELEPRRGRLNLARLEERVTTLRTAGVRDILYVLGSTPAWAASSTASVDLYGPGSSSPPKNVADYERYVTAVVTRFKGRITSYQVWNEANLTSFWRGTPTQMADLTLRVKRIVRKVDPKALVVAASTTTRLTSAYQKFFPAYLRALKARGWPVDVFAGHFYPASTGTPTTRLGLIAIMRRDLRAAGAPNRPLWDTEINFGLKGPGPAYPDRDIEGATAASWVARTYLDSLRAGVARAYWYSWTPPLDLLGISMYRGTRGAGAYTRAHQWLAGGVFRGCSTSSGYTSCRVVKGGVAAAIAWTERGQRRITLPTGVRYACPAGGTCVRVTPGARYLVGPMPVRLSSRP